MTKHPLREEARHILGAPIADLFLSLSVEANEQERTALTRQVKIYVSKLELELAKHEHLDLDLAERLTKASLALLAAYPTLSPQNAALAIGAIRYFVRPQDVSHDVNAVEGLEDDAQVMDFALKHCGISIHNLAQT